MGGHQDVETPCLDVIEEVFAAVADCGRCFEFLVYSQVASLCDCLAIREGRAPPRGGGVPQGAAPGASGEEFGGVRDCASPGAVTPPGGKKGPWGGWLDNAARKTRRNRLGRASYKLPLQVPAAKIAIDDPVELALLEEIVVHIVTREDR